MSLEGVLTRFCEVFCLNFHMRPIFFCFVEICPLSGGDPEIGFSGLTFLCDLVSSKFLDQQKILAKSCLHAKIHCRSMNGWPHMASQNIKIKKRLVYYINFAML